MEEEDWERLIDQLRNGDCTPFLGAGACYGILPTAAELSRAWAETYEYPFQDDEALARVMQYTTVKIRDAVHVKQLICRELGSTPPPDFSNPTEPHALLAEFPLPIFLTTNYDDFLVQALSRAKRKPRVAICPWYEDADYGSDLFTTTPGLRPDPEEPVVYHLHGSFRIPESLVLTEEDYLEFLVNITRARVGTDLRLTPSVVLSALSGPLLFIGYSLQDWTFRVLFHGLLRDIGNTRRRRHVSVQLLPALNGSRRDAERQARDYLSRYFGDWRISIYWGTATDFCAELRLRMGGIA